MLPFAHLASGYLVYASVAHSVEVNSTPLLSAALAGALAPDIDGLFGAQIKDHKNTVFHAPLFWLCMCAIAFTAGKGWFPIFIPPLIVFFLSIFIHLFLDWMSARTSGIRVFYPFSNVREAAGIHGLARGGMSPREAGKRSL